MTKPKEKTYYEKLCEKNGIDLKAHRGLVILTARDFLRIKNYKPRNKLVGKYAIFNRQRV